MDELTLLKEINDNIKKLLGITATQGMADDKKIITLEKMDFSSTQISEMTGIPEGTVRRKWIGKSKKK